MDHQSSESLRADSREGQEAAQAGGLRSPMVFVFAIACGLSVANVYFAHPLLDAIAADFGMSTATIGGVVTLTQFGYALGLIFLVPLGDILDRRRIIVMQGMLLVLALFAVAMAGTSPVFLAAMAAVGLLAVVVQALVAFAAALAAPEDRGKTVGRITSGVVIGILLARFVSGLVADIGGWRAVYALSAALNLGMTLILFRVMPREGPKPLTVSYPALLRSMVLLFLHEPVLRLRAVLALLIFATFSTFWTALVLPLGAPPFAMSHTEVGMFGLIGLFGALAAGKAGQLADRGLGQWTTGWSLVLLVVSWVPIALLHTSLLALVAGIFLLDLAVQAVHVTNQTMIFAIVPDARSRVVAGYMVFYSVGSGIGGIASTALYAKFGWLGVSALGAAFSSAALLFWAAAMLRGHPSGT
jgi:predicted MFS family arabinose efflux permease